MAQADILFSSMNAVVADVFGDAISYNGSPITGVIDLFSMAEKQTGFYQSDGQLWVQKSEVPAWAVGVAVVYGGKNYRTGKLIDEDAQSWTIEINEV